MLTSSQNLAKSMRFIPFLFQILLIAAISFYSSMSIAEMYKWVDEEGNTHYTQSPPPGDIEATNIKPPPKIDNSEGKKKLQDRQRYLDNISKKRSEVETAKQNSQLELEEKRAACESARKRLASFQRPRVNYVDSEGKRARVTEEKRVAEIAKANETIKKLCK
jgi:Domain of unknown function (DUF4124)